MFIPMKPATPDRTAPITKPIVENRSEEKEDDDGHDNADDGDGGVLTLQIGLRAFLNGAGDFLHFFVAGASAENLSAGDDAVDDGKQSQQNCNDNCVHYGSPSEPDCSF